MNSEQETTRTTQRIVRTPEPFDGGVREGIGVDRGDPFGGITISNFSDGEASSTVYIDDEDVPELVKALFEVMNDG